MSTEHPTAETVAICALLRDMERKCTEVNLCNIASIIESQVAKIAELEQALVRTEAHWRQELEVYKSTGEPRETRRAYELVRDAMPIMVRRIDRYTDRAAKQKFEFWAERNREIAQEATLWVLSARQFLDGIESPAGETSEPPHCPSCSCECQHTKMFENKDGYMQCNHCGLVDWKEANTKPAEPCQHQWTFIGVIRDPRPDEICEGGCGLTYAQVRAQLNTGASHDT